MELAKAWEQALSPPPIFFKTFYSRRRAKDFLLFLTSLLYIRLATIVGMARMKTHRRGQTGAYGQRGAAEKPGRKTGEGRGKVLGSRVRGNN